MPATNPPPARGLGDASAKDLREWARVARNWGLLKGVHELRGLAELAESIAALEERAEARTAGEDVGPNWRVNHDGELRWEVRSRGLELRAPCAALSQMGERT